MLVNLQAAQEKCADDAPAARALLDRGRARAGEHRRAARPRRRHPSGDPRQPRLSRRDRRPGGTPAPARQDGGLPEQRLTQEIEASICFFVSEALTNVVRHAQAGSARIGAALEGERLTVEVSDDGVGGAQPGAEGTGLIGLGDRIAALDGTLALDSKPGEGTTLHAVIPIRSDSQSVDSPK